MAPGYLIDLCQPVANIDGHGHLQSVSRGSTDKDGNLRKAAVLLDMPVHLLGTLC